MPDCRAAPSNVIASGSNAIVAAPNDRSNLGMPVSATRNVPCTIFSFANEFCAHLSAHRLRKLYLITKSFRAGFDERSRATVFMVPPVPYDGTV